MSRETRKWVRITAALATVVALSLIVTAAGVLLLQAGAAVAAGVVQVSIGAPAQVAPGSSFAASIDISSVTNLDAANYDVSFDAAVLRLVEVTSGRIDSTAVPVDIWNESRPGTVTVVQNVPGLRGVNGSGSLAILRFQVVGSLSAATRLNLSNGVLSDTLAQAIPAAWTGVLVQAIPPTTAVPASFSLSDFSIMPPEVRPGEPVTISVLLTNIGGSEGSYTVALKVNGQKEAESQIALGSRQLRTVSFTTAKSTAGKYLVDINGKTGEFTVASVAPLTLSPSQGTKLEDLSLLPDVDKSSSAPEAPFSPATESSVTGTAGDLPSAATASLPEAGTVASGEGSPSSPPSPPPAPLPELVNWLVVGGVGAGVLLVIGLFIVFRISRRVG